MQRNKQEEWWQKNGGNSWYQEMECRKAKPHYKNQIILINRVFCEVCSLVDKPTILEMGCGYGRVLSHIQKSFRGVDVHGCDQSGRMLQAAANLGFPREKLYEMNARQPLEYADKFDIVYTCEMLIHISPEDIRQVLRNIIDQSNRYVIHIENCSVSQTEKSSEEHNGCWKHPITRIYNELGHTPEIREQEGTEHTAYIIKTL